MGGEFDNLNCQHMGEFNQKFSKKSNAWGFAGGEGGMDVLEFFTRLITHSMTPTGV